MITFEGVDSVFDTLVETGAFPSCQKKLATNPFLEEDSLPHSLCSMLARLGERSETQNENQPDHFLMYHFISLYVYQQACRIWLPN